jgi:hypothetical protein
MQRGLGNPQGRGKSARKDTVAAITKKFAHMQTSFQREGAVDALKVTDGGKREGILRLVQKRIEDVAGLLKSAPADDKPGLQAQLNAWNMWKVQYEADVLKTPNNDATKDFFAWLLGKGKEEHHRRTPWYRDQALIELDDVRAWIDGFADVFTESANELKKLAWKTPQNLDEAWLYFKFIVQSDWMQREDRFFWVDLVNLMEEKAKLGGGLTKEELDKTRPMVQEVQADGKTVPVPLTQEDAFGPNTKGVEGLFATYDGQEGKEALWREGVLVTLGKQLRQMAGVHDARAGSRHYVELSPLKRADLQRQLTVARMKDEEALALAGQAIDEAKNVVGQLVEDPSWTGLLTGFAGATARGFWADIYGTIQKDPEPLLSGKNLEIAEKAKQALVGLRTELGQDWWSKIEPEKPLSDLRAAIPALETTMVTLEAFVRIKEIDPVLRLSVEGAKRSLERVRDVARLRLDVLDAREAGVPTDEIPKYQAMMASLRTPDMAELRIQTNKLVSEAVRGSEKLAGKTMSTQDISELQGNAYVARVLDLYLGTRRTLLQNFNVKIGREAEFVNAALAERWKVWIGASDIKGALAERFTEAPNDPVKMNSYYKLVLGGIADKSEFLHDFLRADEGRYLRAVFQNVLPPDQVDSITEFEAAMKLHGHKLSEYAKTHMEPVDYLMASALSKSFDALDKFLEGSLVTKLKDWTSTIFKGVINFSWRTFKSLVVSYGSSALAAFSFASTGSAAAGVGVGLLFQLIAKFLTNELNIRSMVTKSFILAQLVNGLALFVGLPSNADSFKVWSFDVIENVERTLNMQGLIPDVTKTASGWEEWFRGHEDMAKTVLAFAIATPVAIAAPYTLGLVGVAGPVATQLATMAAGGAAFTAAQLQGRSLFKTASEYGALLFYGKGGTPLTDKLRTAYFSEDMTERGNVLWNAAWGEGTKIPESGSWFGNLASGFYPSQVPDSPGFFLKSFLALASWEVMMDIGQLTFTTTAQAEAGFGPIPNLLNEKIDNRARAGLAVYHMLWAIPGLVNDIKQSKMEVLENIRAMKDVTQQQIRMDFLDQQQRVAMQRRFADLQSRRRLKEPKHKKKFLKSIHDAADKRTGEGLVKKVGATRVAVQ